MNNIDAKGISKCIIDIRKKHLLYSVKKVIVYFSNLLGSSGKSVISYAMNAVATNFISLKR